MALMKGSSSLLNYYDQWTDHRGKQSDIPQSFMTLGKKTDKKLNSDVSAASPKTSFEWHTGQLGVGDVVVFDSHAIHGASLNREKKFRYSLDFRFALVPSDKEAVVLGRPFCSSNVGKFLSTNTRILDE